MGNSGIARIIRAYICGPTDVKDDIAYLHEALTNLNVTLLGSLNASLTLRNWSLEQGGPAAQQQILKEIAQSDLVIFLFNRRLGKLTPLEFRQALLNFINQGKPQVQVLFKFVPPEFRNRSHPSTKPSSVMICMA